MMPIVVMMIRPMDMENFLMKRSAFLVLAGITAMSPSVWSMEALSDQQMSESAGQALFTMSFIDTGGNNPNAGVGFYKLGLEAKVEINANIKKLQLGCGGDKAAGTGGNCDIDIDDIRLTGLVPTLAAGAAGTDAGPASDFVLNNPFIELAIRNPNSASTRQMVGFRLGADSALGTMSFGNNPTGNNTDDTGINSLSGQLPTTVLKGKIPIRVTSGLLFGTNGFAYTKEYNAVYDDIDPNNGNQDAGYCTNNCDADNSIRGPIWPYQKQLVVNRDQNIVLDNNSKSGRYLNLYANVSSLIGNIKIKNIDAEINQGLRYIHEVKVQDANGNAATDFSLSFQKESIVWKKNGIALNGGFGQNSGFSGANYDTYNAPAQTGWWLNLPQAEISNWTGAQLNLTSNQALSTLFGTKQDYTDLDLGQQAVDNCYGSLTFC